MRSATRKKTGKFPKYLAFLHTLPCLVCTSIPVEAHHAGDHGFGQKADDLTAIPLCKGHHTEWKDSIHRMGKKFWIFHGLDRDKEIRKLQDWYVIEHQLYDTSK